MTDDAGLHVVLFQPEIPQNTGNIIRLCAATGAVLHLVGPVGFRLDAAAVRRAGMDYRELAQVRRYDHWEAYEAAHPPQARLLPLTTQGGRPYTQERFQPGDRLLFGSEGSGLPTALLQRLAASTLRIPMLPQRRSLNLANSVAIVLYEALRQREFPEMA